MVLARLTGGRQHGEVHTVGFFAESPASESAAELARFCGRNLAANRSDWTGFLIREVSEALERIDNGTYGLCLRCGQPIATRRLGALPWVAFCTACRDEEA